MKKLSNAILLFLFFVLCSTLIISCSKKGNEPKVKTEGEISIGFSIDTLIVERWRTDCEVFSSKAKENDANLIILDAANNLSEQIRQIEYMIRQNVDCLVIVAKEASALSDVIQKAKAKGIPVISYDRLILNSDIDLFVTVDCQKVGYLMAESLLSVKKNGGYWCILGPEEDYNMTLVDKGVRSCLENTGISLDVRYFTPDWNYDLSYKKMNSLLDSGLLPEAIICGNDAIAETVIRSISEHRLGKNIPVVGQDAEVLACRRVQEGLQTATVYKPITNLAEKAAELACRLARGESAESLTELSGQIDNGLKKVPSVLLEPVLVTKDNLKSVIIDSGFHSETEIYR